MIIEHGEEKTVPVMPGKAFGIQEVKVLIKNSVCLLKNVV